MKHRLKLWLRTLIAWVAHATGLRALFRARRGGVPILMFHNVGFPPETAHLPGHMKIGEERLERLLAALGRSGYRTLTVRDLVAAFERGERPADAVVLTFDDGYRDNHDLLLPILKRHGATATVYVQTGPMKGRLNWLHHYFWVIHAVGPRRLGELIAARIDRAQLQAELRGLDVDPVAAEYKLKRLMKYELAAADRDRILADAFVEVGGDEAALAARTYLGPEECRALDAAGVELGAHTVNHLVLSSLSPEEQRAEIEGSLTDLRAWLGRDVTTFAYPYGRAWDYDERTLAILRELGFRGALTATNGLNDPATPRLELRRLAVTQTTPLAEVLCEVDGVFDWLARRGLPLPSGT